MTLCCLSLGWYVSVLMYAAKLAEEEASMPVTWWYTPIFMLDQRLSLTHPHAFLLVLSACYAYLLCTALDRLLHQMYDIWRTEFAQGREAVGPDLNHRMCIVFI